MTCCKGCKDRKVTDSYNCHTHCERYAKWAAEQKAKQELIKSAKAAELIQETIFFDGIKRKRGKK